MPNFYTDTSADYDYPLGHCFVVFALSLPFMVSIETVGELSQFCCLRVAKKHEHHF